MWVTWRLEAVDGCRDAQAHSSGHIPDVVGRLLGWQHRGLQTAPFDGAQAERPHPGPQPFAALACCCHGTYRETAGICLCNRKKKKTIISSIFGVLSCLRSHIWEMSHLRCLLI